MSDEALRRREAAMLSGVVGDAEPPFMARRREPGIAPP